MKLTFSQRNAVLRQKVLLRESYVCQTFVFAIIEHLIEMRFK